MMQAASTSETSVNFCQTTRRNNPEDSHLQEHLYCTLPFEKHRQERVKTERKASFN
jgi:hypothetical protein